MTTTEMTRATYEGARAIILRDHADDPQSCAGALAALDARFRAQGGTPTLDERGPAAAAEAQATSDAREREIASMTRRFMDESRLGHTAPISPDWAHEKATRIVDATAQFPHDENPLALKSANEIRVAMAAGYAIQEKEAADHQAFVDQLVAGRAERDKAKAAVDLKVQQENAQRQALMGTGMSFEQATQRLGLTSPPTTAPQAPQRESLADQRARVFATRPGE